LDTLDALSKRLNPDGDGDDTGLGDFGNQLLPELVSAGKVYAHELKGYWKDVGRPETFFQAHMDLLAERTGLNLDDPSWPILTLGHQRLPAKIHETAAITNSLISPGCDIRGRVERSVLAPGVVVAEGAEVCDAVLFHDSVVESGARVHYAIVDGQARIGANARVGGQPNGDLPTSEELTLIGQGARLEGAKTVERGARVEPGATE
ncbi:MAG: glucose-1-phosphate adenylyltransferase, partial [Chloroflexota bacterium]|nr:glucose-1-phosphate adenylyltransferase [Chloroflexota bacterium]